ncbi:prothoracicotropic hormone [Chelonus insularis]|uniref:prothoracicotropic hormone n=1 Tax=Chelonus insularis TaxID=460826 RepID=UPI00158E4C8B|nr:prothoracicotropic hormone-like [Chelonus insularis]
MKTTIVCMILLCVKMMKNCQAYNSAQWTNIILDSDSLDDDRSWINNPEGYLYAEKRTKDTEQINKLRSSSKDLFSSHGPWQWLCPCETQYDIVDLGQGNYPRYLATARCVAKPCHGKFNPCKLIYYKVHVLSQRELDDRSDAADDTYIDQSLLPESLQVKWQLKPLKVAVACIPATEGQNN